MSYLADRLARESARHMGILERLGEKLAVSIDTDGLRDGDGVVCSVTPSRDWCRAMGIYQTGMANLLTEERERTKLRLLAEKGGGHRALTDEEYEAEMRSLAVEALRALPPGEIEAEVKRRGLVVKVPSEVDE